MMENYSVVKRMKYEAKLMELEQLILTKVCVMASI